MNTQEQAFIDAVIDSPLDNAPRLLFADWLEENDRCQQAEFVRVQCRIAQLPQHDPKRAELCRRERSLLHAAGSWLTEDVPADPRVVRDLNSEFFLLSKNTMYEDEQDAKLRLARRRRGYYRRGFLETLWVEAFWLVRHAKQLQKRWPIQIVRLLDPVTSGEWAFLKDRYKGVEIIPHESSDSIRSPRDYSPEELAQVMTPPDGGRSTSNSIVRRMSADGRPSLKQPGFVALSEGKT